MSNNNYESVIDNNAAADFTASTNKSRPEPLILKLFQLGFAIGGRLFPALAARLAYKLWLTPTRFKTPVSERSALESAVVEYHQINDSNIATYSWGRSKRAAGPTVLLVHGWSGRGTQLGSFVEPLINAGYRVLSFDTPAHGKSSGKQTNIYEIADVIVALQEHYGEFDSVITHSFGGPCTALAVKHGLKTNRIVSICPPATTIGLVDKFVSTLHITGKTAAKLVHNIEKTFGKHLWKELSMTNIVKEMNIPGLVIHDMHDTDISWEEGQAVAYAWNNAPFKITNGLGHRRILRDSSVIGSAVDFIKNEKITK